MKLLELTPQVISALKGDHSYCHLVRMELANNNTIRLTDNGYDIDWDSEEYIANGLLLDMDTPSFSSELRVGEVKLAFTAVDQSMVALMLGTNQVNRYVYVYRAYLDGSELIPNPLLLHAWLITGIDVADRDSDSQIAVSMASEWADFEAPRGRRTTDASQRRFFPNDRGFEFAAQVKKEIKWGGA